MAYCKTRTYLNLKRIADRAYTKACELGDDEYWEYATDLEMECAFYAQENEEEIDWEQVTNA